MKVLALALLLCVQSSAFFGGPRRASMPRTLEVEKRLIEIVEVLNGRGARENREKSEVFRSIEASIAELEESTAEIKDYNPITADLDGTWRLLYTSSPGTWDAVVIVKKPGSKWSAMLCSSPVKCVSWFG